MNGKELTGAEQRALRVIATGEGQAAWYRIERLVTSLDYPDQETNSVRSLTRLEEMQLIEKVPGGGKMQWFAVTPAGAERLRQTQHTA